MSTSNLFRTAGVAALALGSLAAAASAEDKLTYSVTVGGTSDYVFRGISQTFEEPAFQASVDLAYGMFYAGVWGSKVDFGEDRLTVFGAPFGPEANAEVDLYAGIKPTWGPATFDFGVIYYWYPGADDWANFNNFCPGPCPNEIDYVELKAGVSASFVKNLTTGVTVFWSPDYTLDTNDVWTVEAVASYTFPSMGPVTPTISGTWGHVDGDKTDGFSAGGAAIGDNDDDYDYWNAGLALAVEKFTFDFRYWDTNIEVFSPFGSCVKQDLCDERFVFSLKVTLP